MKTSSLIGIHSVPESSALCQNSSPLLDHVGDGTQDVGIPSITSEVSAYGKAISVRVGGVKMEPCKKRRELPSTAASENIREGRVLVATEEGPLVSLGPAPDHYCLSTSEKYHLHLPRTQLLQVLHPVSCAQAASWSGECRPHESQPLCALLLPRDCCPLWTWSASRN